MILTIPAMKTALAAALLCNSACYVEGVPGIGKSQGVYQVAFQRRADQIAALKAMHPTSMHAAIDAASASVPVMIDIRLSMWESIDLRGIPAVIDGRTAWVRPEIWPSENEFGFETVLFFDEMDRPSTPAVLNAALQIVLDRRIGEFKLPSTVRIVGAGNGKTDKGTTVTLPLALRKRFLFLPVAYDSESTINHFADIALEPVLVAFIKFRPLLGYTTPAVGEFSSSDPRAWEECNRFLKLPEDIRRVLIRGRVGKACADEFEAFHAIYSAQNMPDIAKVLAGEAQPFPAELSCQFAVVLALARAVTAPTMANMLAYFAALPEARDMATAAIIDAVKRKPYLKETGAFNRWQMANPAVAMGA